MTGLRAMNPINAEGNIFANLFDKVPARRAGVPDDIVGTILYLVSKAGVSTPNMTWMEIDFRRMLMDGLCVLMVGEFLLPMGRNEVPPREGISRGQCVCEVYILVFWNGISANQRTNTYGFLLIGC
jgi:hypothetical protein